MSLQWRKGRDVVEVADVGMRVCGGCGKRGDGKKERERGEQNEQRRMGRLLL